MSSSTQLLSAHIPDLPHLCRTQPHLLTLPVKLGNVPVTPAARIIPRMSHPLPGQAQVRNLKHGSCVLALLL